MARVMVGDREAWYPVHLARERDGDTVPHPIFARPAVRSYDIGGPFDAWRAAVDERISSVMDGLHASFSARVRAARELLDVPSIRRGYRTLRAAYRACCWGLWAVLYDGDDTAWPVGLFACVALSVFVYTIRAL